MTRILTLATIVWLEMIRRKDLYVLLILLAALLLTLVSLNIFGLGSVVGHIKDVGFLMVWIMSWVLAVTCSTRELPQEETRRTIFSLLAKPVARHQVVIGKWLGSWSVVTGATLLFYLLVNFVVMAKGGRLPLLPLFQAFLLHAAALSVVTATGILFSTRTNQDAAVTLTYIATGAAFLIVPRTPQLFPYAKGMAGTILAVLYYLAPHFELFDMRRRVIHGYGPASWRIFLAVMAYGLLYCSLLLVIAAWMYRKKRFARNALY